MPTVKKVERELRNLRLPVADIERAKQRATAKGFGYQTLIHMLLHEALHR